MSQNVSPRPVVGVMTGSLNTDYVNLLVDSICDALRDQKVDICLFQGLDASRFLDVDNYVDAGFDDHYYTQFEYGRFVRPDLLVLSYGTISGVTNALPLESFLSRLPRAPVVVLEAEADLPNVMCITVDNYSGMKECVDHLIEVHGCRSVLFLAGPSGVPDSELRLKAWRDAMAEHSLPVTEEMFAYGDFTDRVDSEVEKLLLSCPHPDAIVCANDEMAECTYRLLRRHGLEPGQDVAVTGFDDTACRLSPALTSVTQNTREVAEILAKSIPAALSGALPESVRIAPRVFYRQSCGCPGTARPEPGRISPVPSVPTGEERFKRLKRDSMLAALMLRSLLMERVDEQAFFHALGNLLWSLNTPCSRLALLPKPVVVDRKRNSIVPPTLHVTMEQNGAQVCAFSRDSAPAADALKPLASASAQKRLLTAFFPLFFGSIHYGAFMVALEREDMPFYYTLSLEIGTAMRYLALSLARQEDRDALEEKNQILKFSASHDILTGLYNRAGLMNQIFDLLHEHGSGTPCALVVADLDHLKQINDTFGHSAGDEAIRGAAQTLVQALPPDSPLGRTGGDEFTALVLLRDGWSVERLQELIRQDVEQYNRNSSSPWYLGISVGFSSFVYAHPSQISEQLELADQQLYQAKALRRKSVIRTQPSNEEH